jgi:hypothetical protein
MSELLDVEVVRQRLTALPIETYEAGDVVLADGTTTGKVLLLKEGAVEVVKDGVQLGCQRHFESAPGLVEVGNLVLTHPALRPWFPRAGTRGVSSPPSSSPWSWSAVPGCRPGACP